MFDLTILVYYFNSTLQKYDVFFNPPNFLEEKCVCKLFFNICAMASCKHPSKKFRNDMQKTPRDLPLDVGNGNTYN